MPPIRETRTPQTRPVVRARAAWRGDTHTIRLTRRNTEGLVAAPRCAPPVRRRRPGEAATPDALLARVRALATFPVFRVS